MLKFRSLFSGIGSPESALKNIGIDFELVDFCEVDKYAIKSYCAVHGVSEDKNLGDVSKVWGRDLPYADLMVWGFPCTDISVAGKGTGIIEGVTRSGLYYEGFRILRETKPKYSIIENVKNLTGKKFKAEFEQMLTDIEKLGYNNYWQVLNAKNYGIPQNRERVFIVSIRKDVDFSKFEFPIGFDNGLRLKDFLENEVDEKFYISQEKTNKLLSQLKGNIGEGGLLQERNGTFGKTDVHSLDGYSPAITATCYKGPDMVATVVKVGNTTPSGKSQCNDVVAAEGLYPNICAGVHGNCNPSILENKCIQVGNLEQPGYHESCNRVYAPEGIARTLMGGGGNLNDKAGQYLIDYRIRRLTPKECWRLMGFSDTEFQKAVDAGVSNSQLYKQAGNSIVTNVLSGIFKKLLRADIQANIDADNILS